MKKISQIFLLLLVAAGLPFSSVANPGNDGAISGNGKVTTQNRTIGSFHALKVSGGIDVDLSQGNDIKLQVEADENLIENIRTVVKDGVLNIYPEESVRKAKVMKIHLTFRDIDAINASGGCDITSTQKLDFTTLQTDLSGGCDIKLELKVNNLVSKHNGGCDATFNGEAENCTLKVSGGCDVKASDFHIKNCSVDASGGSDVWVYATGILDLKASGASDVTYAGSPSKVTKSASGASDIHCK